MGQFADVQGGERQHYQGNDGRGQGRAHGEDQRGQQQRYHHRDRDEPGRLGVDDEAAPPSGWTPSTIATVVPPAWGPLTRGPSPP